VRFISVFGTTPLLALLLYAAASAAAQSNSAAREVRPELRTQLGVASAQTYGSGGPFTYGVAASGTVKLVVQ